MSDNTPTAVEVDALAQYYERMATWHRGYHADPLRDHVSEGNRCADTARMLRTLHAEVAQLREALAEAQKVRDVQGSPIEVIDLRLLEED